MTSISKSVYTNKLNDIVDKNNNTYHRTIKTKPVDKKPSAYTDSSKEINDEDPKLEFGDIIRISKYKNILQNLCSKLVWRNFVIKKVKNAVPWRYVISDLKGKEIVGTF